LLWKSPPRLVSSWDLLFATEFEPAPQFLFSDSSFFHAPYGLFQSTVFLQGRLNGVQTFPDSLVMIACLPCLVCPDWCGILVFFFSWFSFFCGRRFFLQPATWAATFGGLVFFQKVSSPQK